MTYHSYLYHQISPAYHRLKTALLMLYCDISIRPRYRPTFAVIYLFYYSFVYFCFPLFCIFRSIYFKLSIHIFTILIFTYFFLTLQITYFLSLIVCFSVIAYVLSLVERSSFIFFSPKSFSLLPFLSSRLSFKVDHYLGTPFFYAIG